MQEAFDNKILNRTLYNDTNILKKVSHAVEMSISFNLTRKDYCHAKKVIENHPIIKHG